MYRFEEDTWWYKIYRIEATDLLESTDITDKARIEVFKMDNQRVNHFPRAIGSFFRRLRIVTITSCGLKSISRHHLKKIVNLEKLDLSLNLLKTLPSDLFINMEKLKSVSFENNKLENVTSKLLQPILKNNPTLVDFRGNSKIDAIYDSKLPEEISLQVLMDLIDSNCNKPVDERRKQFTAIESFEKDFIAGFAALWESGEHSDFTIIANGPKEFHVHKAVLSIQSSVFAAMFKNNMEEQRTGQMTIPDFSAEALEQFLVCLYTGKIKDVSYAMDLFALAVKYDVPKLKWASEQNVLQNIDQENALDILTLGRLYSSTDMQYEAFGFIKQTFPDLDDDLMTDPEGLKAMITATENRNRKMKEAEDDYESACKRSKK